MKLYTLRLSNNLKNNLKELASSRGVSMASLIKGEMSTFLIEKKQIPTKARLKERENQSFTFYIPLEMKQSLESIAKANNVTLAHLIKQVMTEVLQRDK